MTSPSASLFLFRNDDGLVNPFRSNAATFERRDLHLIHPLLDDVFLLSLLLFIRFKALALRARSAVKVFVLSHLACAWVVETTLWADL